MDRPIKVIQAPTKPTWITKLVLRALALIFGISLIGLIGAIAAIHRYSYYDDGYYYSSSDAWLPLAIVGGQIIVSICWNIAEIISILVRRGHRGTHPGACVGMDLLLWIGVLVGISMLGAFCWGATCGYDFDEDGDEGPAVLSRTKALLGLGSILTFLHIVLFCIACWETSVRNSVPKVVLDRNGAPLRPAPGDAKMYQQPQVYYPPQQPIPHAGTIPVQNLGTGPAPGHPEAKVSEYYARAEPVHQQGGPALSCVECRRRKIKCDRENPCAHCVAAKSECSYKTFNNRSSAPGSWNTLKHAVGNVPQDTPDSDSAPVSALLNTPALDVVNGTARRSHPTQQQADESVVFRDLLDRVRRLEATPASSLAPTRSPSDASRDVLSLQTGPIQDAQILLNKTRVLRWSFWTGMSEELMPIISCFSEACKPTGKGPFAQEDIAPVVADMGRLLRKCKMIAKDLKASRPSRTLSSTEVHLYPPARETADKLVHLYFQSFESVYRILHRPTFMAEYRNYWDDPTAATDATRLKLLLVIALGSSIQELDGSDPFLDEQTHSWVYAAQTWLAGPLEKDRLNIAGLQVHCLTILARQVFSMGLHRDPDRLPSMSLLTAEMRRRLWATILEMTVQASLDAAMPPRISFDDFDTRAPRNCNDEDLSESSTAGQEQHPRQEFTETSIQLILYDSLPTRLRILRLLNDLHSELSYPDVLRLSSEITDICRGLDTATAIGTPEPDDAFTRLSIAGGGLFKEGFRYAMSAIGLELVTRVEERRLDGTLRRPSEYCEGLKRTLRSMLALSLERVRAGETNVKGHMFLQMILAQAEAKEAGVPCELHIATAARESLELCYGVLRERAEVARLGCADVNADTP
ncbi:unnamed protein product [Parascedosporium putredinis]|uniref:Zn(2)-C6 fungal-type domain-containing protein n=1 Tax=Parascedosporium putredinis TaxID=1442378 RepID=A0A9P1GZN8_9PEZI|nr:unnamed protein product [Parascedosporium putredinis]CAI7991854.1 unnamed protein product [Parascedosporium putredinis]